MTAYGLQEDIAAEVEKILRDMRLKDVKGNEAPLKAYCQELPRRIQEVAERLGDNADIVISEESAEDSIYPYCVVRLDSGEMNNTRDVQAIQTVLVFGIYDDDVQCQGHKVILNMIHKIAERFIKNPVLNGCYKLNEDSGITWMLDDQNPYAYYYGAMTMTWNAFFAGREIDRYV